MKSNKIQLLVVILLIIISISSCQRVAPIPTTMLGNNQITIPLIK